MAELLGLVSGGAGLFSVAIQLLQGAQKLKRICNDMRGAKARLDLLIEEVETVKFALELMHYRYPQSATDAQDSQASEVVNRCVAGVNRRLVALHNILTKIDSRIIKTNSLGKLSFALKVEDISAALVELDHSKVALQTALMIKQDLLREHMIERCANQYLGVFRQVQAELADIKSGLPGVQYSTAEDDVGAAAIHQERSRLGPVSPQRVRHRDARPQKAKHFRICLPSLIWVRTQLWDIALTRAEGLWNVQLHIMNVLPWDAVVFEFCKAGDIINIQRMLQNGEASAFDCREDGETLLSIAASSGQVDLCRLFLESTGVPSSSDDLSRALCAFARHSKAYVREQVADAMYELFLTEHGIDFGTRDFELLNQSPDVLPWFNNTTASQGLSLCRNKGLSLAAHSILSWWNDVSLWWNEGIPTESIWKHLYVLHLENRETSVACISPEHLAIVTLHTTAAELVHAVAEGSRPPGDMWAVRACIHAGISPSAVHAGQTALMRILTEREWTSPRAPGMIIYRWAQYVEGYGLDLVRYGVAERAKWDDLFPPSHLLKVKGWVVDGLAYGPKPEDWTCTVRHVMHVPRYRRARLPGTWPLHHCVPETICWEPSYLDGDEDVWEESVSPAVRLVSGPFVSGFRSPREGRSVFDEMVCKTQDDNGVVARIVAGSQRAYQPRPRSHSQPRLFRTVPPGVVERHCVKHRHARAWLRYHHCPVTSKHQVPCRGDANHVSHSPRECLHDSGPHVEVQETRTWKKYSFLASLGFRIPT